MRITFQRAVVGLALAAAASGCNIPNDAYFFAGDWTGDTTLTLTTGGNAGVQKQQGRTALTAEGDSILTTTLWSHDCPLGFKQDSTGAPTFTLQPKSCPGGASGMSGEFTSGKLEFTGSYSVKVTAAGTFSATDGRTGTVAMEFTGTR